MDKLDAEVRDKLFYAGSAEQFVLVKHFNPSVPVLMNCRRLNAEVTRPRLTTVRILSKSHQNSTQFDHCRFWTYMLKREDDPPPAWSAACRAVQTSLVPEILRTDCVTLTAAPKSVSSEGLDELFNRVNMLLGDPSAASNSHAGRRVR